MRRRSRRSSVLVAEATEQLTAALDRLSPDAAASVAVAILRPIQFRGNRRDDRLPAEHHVEPLPPGFGDVAEVDGGENDMSENLHKLQRVLEQVTAAGDVPEADLDAKARDVARCMARSRAIAGSGPTGANALPTPGRRRQPLLRSGFGAFFIAGWLEKHAGRTRSLRRCEQRSGVFTFYSHVSVAHVVGLANRRVAIGRRPNELARYGKPIPRKAASRRRTHGCNKPSATVRLQEHPTASDNLSEDDLLDERSRG